MRTPHLGLTRGYLWPTRVCPASGISLRSNVFAGLNNLRNTQACRQTDAETTDSTCKIGKNTNHTRCYFNVRSKAHIVNFIFRTEPKTKKWKTEKQKKVKKRVCSEVSANSPGNRAVSPGEEMVGYGGKDLQKRKVLSLE